MVPAKVIQGTTKISVVAIGLGITTAPIIKVEQDITKVLTTGTTA